MEKKIGEVTHFFGGPSAAVLKLSGELKVGDKIHLVGFTTDFTEKVTSMQVNHQPVESAVPGDDVAILVKDRVREGDEVFVVTQDAKPKAKPKAKAKSKAKAKPKAKPKKAKAKAKAKPKKKAKAKPKRKAKTKAKSKPKKKRK